MCLINFAKHFLSCYDFVYRQLGGANLIFMLLPYVIFIGQVVLTVADASQCIADIILKLYINIVMVVKANREISTSWCFTLSGQNGVNAFIKCLNPHYIKLT